MQKRTRVLAIVGVLIGLPLVALAVLPAMFGGRIAARAKAEANTALNARVDWRDAGLSLFGDFPNLTLTLDDLSVAGVNKFAGDTLARVSKLAVVLDLGSVVRNLRSDAPIVIRSVALDRPNVGLRVLEDGSANWDITKPASPGRSASSPLKVTLEQLDIRDGRLTLDDRQAKLAASVSGFRQLLSGDFGEERFVLETSTHADSVSLEFAGVPYLTRVALDIAADLDADMRAKKFTFRKNEIRLNDLLVAVTGSATIGDDHTALDLAFNAPRTEFRHILSLVPAIYARDFQKLRTSGAFTVSGNVKGQYGERAFPSFAVDARVDNAAFQYPDLPLPARDIAFALSLRNPGGSADSTIVRLDKFHARIGAEPIDGALVLRTPVSDPDVDLRLTGKLDLADVQRTVKLANVKQLAGRVAADIAVRTRMSAIDRKQYDRIAARGTIDVSNLALESADLPHPLAIQEAALQLTPRRAELRSFTGSVGSSDMRLTGYIENLVPFAFRGDDLRGSATFASRRFNLDEWQSDNDTLEVIPVPANIDFALQATVDELTYGKMKMSDARGGLRVKDQRVTLENFSMNTLGGELGLTGFYETTNVAKPTFDVDVRMKSIDIPSAFAALTTVQVLAPVAKFARGSVSTDLHLAGPLDKNMVPLFAVLDGKGSLRTSELVIQGLPLLGKVADALKLDRLRSPTLDSLRASIQINGGRVHLNPFNVRVGQTNLRVAGSHGIDQSLQYTLGLRVPRSELGAGANQVIAGLASRAGKAGLDLQAAEAVELDVKVGGTLTNPTVQTNLGDVVASTAQTVKEAAQQEVAERVDSLKAKADSAVDDARRKAQAEAERLIGEAEQRGEQIKAEAQKLAETVRREGTARADTLVARATNPFAKAAARPAADRLKKEANDRADQIIREADKRAADLVAEARKKAAALGPG
jgi:hypothetical protein